MFKKRAIRNLRQKRDESDDEAPRFNNDDDDEKTNSPKVNVSSRDSTPASTENSRQSMSVKGGSTLLSFGVEENEDEVEVFKVKKSNQSRKLEKMRQKMRAEMDSPKTSSNEDSHAKNGSKKASSDVVSSQKSLNSDFSRRGKKKVNDEDDDVVVLSGKDAEAIDHAIEDQNENFRKSLKPGEIPDANLIHLARKQRQAARDGGNDFIPLDDTQKYRKEKSRLVREDDENENSDSGEEGGQFYSRKINENDEERRQVESEFLNIEQGSDSDGNDDAEFDRWEREQIKKGVSMQQLNLYQQEQMAASGYYMMNQNASYAAVGQQPYYVGSDMSYYDNATVSSVNEIKEPQPMDLDIELPPHDDIEAPTVVGVFRGCAPLPIIGGVSHEGFLSSSKQSMSFSSLRDKITEKFEESNSLVRALNLDLEKLKHQKAENVDIVEKLEESEPKLCSQFEFYQEIRAFIRDLLDCFDDKLVAIEELEQRAVKLYQSKSNFVIRRRQQDVRDQFDECSASALGKNQVVQDPDRFMRAAEREARKTRRRQAREKTLAGLSHHEGLSSDDEEAPSRIANFAAEKEKILNDAGLVFSDVVDDFCSISSIVERFLTWRKRDFDSYDQAFVDMCLAKLVSPLIRLEMVLFNPTDVDFQGVEKFSWFQSLENSVSEYNLGTYRDDNVKSREPNKDEVGFLISSVIEKAVCPKLTEFVDRIWDAASTSQCERLAALVRHLIKEYFSSNPTENKALRCLLDSVTKRIRVSLDDDLFTPIYSKEIIENKVNSAASFMDRQFWFALKFFKNVLLWEDILPTTVVQELTLDGVLNRHLVLGLQCSLGTEASTSIKYKAICSLFPASWTKKNETLKQLDPLFKVLARIAEEIYQSKVVEKKDASERIKEIYKMFSKLGDSRFSATLVDKYRIRI